MLPVHACVAINYRTSDNSIPLPPLSENTNTFQLSSNFLAHLFRKKSSSNLIVARAPICKPTGKLPQRSALEEAVGAAGEGAVPVGAHRNWRTRMVHLRAEVRYLMFQL